MMTENYDVLISKARSALQTDDTIVALVHLENAYRLQPSPFVCSGLGYCLAKERRQFQKALELCRGALHDDPRSPEHYYHLGRIYLLARRKKQAIASFRRGLKLKRYQPIINELSRLGLRRAPVFHRLPREHLLNRSMGKLLNRLGVR